MEELLKQIENSSLNGNYLVALYVSLALPDICGALESDNGIATGNRYQQWFNKWVSPKYEGQLSGAQCYAYRCGVLHQGRSKHKNLGYSRIVFFEPNPNFFAHRNTINDAYNIDLVTFCHDIVSSVREWHLTIYKSKKFIKNYEHFMKRYENGLAPFVSGIPVIA